VLPENIRFLSEISDSWNGKNYYLVLRLQFTSNNNGESSLCVDYLQCSSHFGSDDRTYMESNPFNLYLSGGNGKEGSFLIRSALLLTGPNGEPMLNQYWMIQLGENGRIDGTLAPGSLCLHFKLWQLRGRPT
jgi:hypothetical protein